MSRGDVVVLSGGVGGAKLALGLYHELPANTLNAIINTGDDFDHYGLRICPDIDTTLYTLAGIANAEQGWGRANETWQCLDTLEALGGESWFRLGDRDLALHLMRTQSLAEGGTLSGFTQTIANQLNINARILPMSDQTVSTQLDTDSGRLAFQDYFVRRRCEPVVNALSFAGSAEAEPAPGILSALADRALRAIIIAPSNPFLSIDPILAVPRLRHAIIQSPAPVIAVTPVIGDSAVKGPTAKIMRELNLDPASRTIAAYYEDLIDGYVLDQRDAQQETELPCRSLCTDTLMVSLEDRCRLAREVLAFADTLAESRRGDI